MMHLPINLPYVRSAPTVRDELLEKLATGTRHLTELEEAHLVDDIRRAALCMRKLREDFEEETGEMVWVEPPAEP